MNNGYDTLTIEIRPTNRHLRLWLATWHHGPMSGRTDPVPRDLLADRVGEVIRLRLALEDRLAGQATKEERVE